MSDIDGIKTCDMNGGHVGNCPYKGIIEKVKRLQSELNNCRNELCLKCGNYHESYAGACNGCKYRRDGEWRDDLYD